MIRYRDLRFVSVSQGIDTEQKQSDVLMTIHALFDELWNKELAEKTHRGLEGRALKGLITGGRTYGYDSVPVPTAIGAGGVPARRREVNDAEAAVVRRIFEMYADGRSFKSVAKILNSERIPPPNKRKDRLHATWCPSAIREMLRRELYIGRVVGIAVITSKSLDQINVRYVYVTSRSGPPRLSCQNFASSMMHFGNAFRTDLKS